MYSRVISVALSGIEGYAVNVESDVSQGLPDFAMVGFLSSEVREARERVRTALRNSGFQIPPRKVTVNLSPADIKKEGTAYDLAIAVSLLTGYGEIPKEATRGTALIGELTLDGRVCPVNGVLPRVAAARDMGLPVCFVPWDCRMEGAVIEGIRVIGVRTLRETVHLLMNPAQQHAEESPAGLLFAREEERTEEDFSEVHGQETVRRAAEIAAAGMHNLLLIGPPGSGKSMIARRIPTILPRMTLDESLEVSRIYSVASMLDPEHPLILRRPFRSPHHTISSAALVGGGRSPRPGEISLADRGVLFLDELPEFQKMTLEVLRQPMEDRSVHVSRVNGSCCFPADTMIVAAMNPCRCGYYPDRTRCRCTEQEVRRYLGRISRPLLDRMDLCAEASPVPYSQLEEARRSESSSAIRERVIRVQNIQKERFAGTDILFNSRMTEGYIREFCALGHSERELLRQIFESRMMSARAYVRILRVARTIADLAGEANIRCPHILEAASYRSLESKYWG